MFLSWQLNHDEFPAKDHRRPRRQLWGPIDAVQSLTNTPIVARNVCFYLDAYIACDIQLGSSTWRGVTVTKDDTKVSTV